MVESGHPTPHCRIYRGCGEPPIEVDPPLRSLPYRAPLPGRAWLQAIMSRELVCGQPDLPVEAIVRLMRDHHVGCLPIVDGGLRPVGVVTRSDLVDRLAILPRSEREKSARGASRGSLRAPSRLRSATAADVMSVRVLTLDDRATIADAAGLMLREHVHHVLVVCAAQTLVGIVSAQDVVGWVLEHEHLAVGQAPPRRAAAWHPDDG